MPSKHDQSIAIVARICMAPHGPQDYEYLSLVSSPQVQHGTDYISLIGSANSPRKLIYTYVLPAEHCMSKEVVQPGQCAGITSLKSDGSTAARLTSGPAGGRATSTSALVCRLSLSFDHASTVSHMHPLCLVDVSGQALTRTDKLAQHSRCPREVCTPCEVASNKSAAFLNLVKFQSSAHQDVLAAAKRPLMHSHVTEISRSFTPLQRTPLVAVHIEATRSKDVASFCQLSAFTGRVVEEHAGRHIKGSKCVSSIQVVCRY